MTPELYDEWQTNCDPLAGSFFFDCKINAVTIILRSPTGVEQVGTVWSTLALTAFKGLPTDAQLDNLTPKGWTWKLVDGGFK